MGVEKISTTTDDVTDSVSVEQHKITYKRGDYEKKLME